MKIFLYFPHLISVSQRQPFPSIPILSAYLKEKTNFPVVCKDINVDIISKLRSQDAEQPPQNQSASPDAIKRALMEVLGRASNLRNDHSSQNAGHLPDTVGEYFNYGCLTFERLRSILGDDGPDPVIELLGQRYFDDIKLCRDKVLVGFSIAFFPQFAPMLSLAKHLKRLNKNIFIVVGGAVIRHVSRNLESIPELFDVIDCFVETEGEEVLFELTFSLDQGKDWSKVPGVIFRDASGNIIKVPAKPFDLLKHVVPDYSFVGNHSYVEPKKAFLRTSIGCYWNKCKFCTQAFGQYKQLPVETIVGDMTALMSKYGIREFHMSDEAIPFPKLLKIAQLLIAKGISVPWASYSRFDSTITDSFCETLAKSGCESLCFGLESGCQRVNDMICKGVDLKVAQQVIDKLTSHRILCGINAIIGFPGETEAEMIETIHFIKRNAHPRFSASISQFYLNYGSDFYKHPEDFGITNIESPNRYFYRFDHGFSCTNQLLPSRINQLLAMADINDIDVLIRELNDTAGFLTLYNLGSALERSGRREEAVRILGIIAEMLSVLDPELAGKASYKLALLSADPSIRIEYLRRCVRLCPDHKAGAVMLDKLMK